MASNQESEIKEKLAELPGRNQQCDVILQIGINSFMANKDVLKLRMEYFRGMFNANMQEKDKMIIQLDPEIVGPAVFDELLEYVYTFNITLTTENFQSIYKAVDFFCFDELKEKTEHFMKSNIDMDHVSCIFDIAVKSNLKNLEEACKHFITSNPLLHAKALPAVGYLNYEELSTLLQSQYNLAKFEDMFHSIIAWILYDEQNRSERILELLQLIPLRRLSLYFCNQVIAENSIVMNDMKCLQWLFKSITSNPPAEELYVFGGKDGIYLSSMSKYDSSTRQWVELESMLTKLTHFACAVLNQEIYVCGGHNGQRYVNELLKFDTNTRKWTTLKATKYLREGCAMAVLDGHLYVAGGYDNTSKQLSVVERYSIENDEWKEVSPMKQKRNALELVQMNGFLYALGGNDGNSDLKTVEQYDPQTDKWTLIANMNNSYGWFGSTVLKNRIYVLGKYGFEEYIPEEDKWRIMTFPINCEGGPRLAVFDGNLFAIGGRIGELKDFKGIKTMEYYDFEKSSWKPAEDMNIARCYHGVAVVTRKYTSE